MSTKILEFQRLEIAADVEQLTVNFYKGHSEIPVVTSTLEASGTSSNVQNTNIYIESISKTKVTFRFSFPVAGYLHIHASSIKRQL